jgi:cyclomaltodextrinase
MSSKTLSFFIACILGAGIFLQSCSSEQPVAETYSPETPEWAYSATIYEVNVRQFSEEGTFKKVEEALPRLKDMGVKILWLMPIHPIGEVERKGTMGSYYSVKDYFDVNPEFGTKEEFRSLVQAAHALDMRLILDWVANHTAWDNEIATTNPEFFELTEDGNFMPPRGTDWSDVIQLNFDNPDVWDYMISALEYWVREFDIDGYRADVADMVPTEFWNRARQELDEIKPVFMLAEADNPALHPAFDASYGWRMHHLYNAIAQGREPVSKIDELRETIANEFPPNAFMMNFTSNHDENSWNGTVFERLGDAVETFAVLSVTMEGMPLLYNGQETGLSKRLEFFEKDPIEWDYESPFAEFYSTLFNLKRTHPALKNGERGAELIRISTSADEAVYAFYRGTDSKVLVLLNLSANAVTFTADSLPEGTFTNVFTNDTLEPSASAEHSLDPWGYLVLVK